MSPLRDPAASALNNVLRCAEQSAELYEDAAERSDDREVNALFARIAAERRDLARRLSGPVRSLGELPEAPDPDAEDLHRLLNAARAFFSTEADRSLLADRRRAEQELAEAVEAARAEEIPEEAQRLLDDAERRIAAVRRRLTEVAPEQPSDA